MPASGVGWTERAWTVLIAVLLVALPIIETMAEGNPPPANVANALTVKAAAESAFKQDILGNFVRTVENQALSLAGSEFTRRYADGYDEASRSQVTTLFHAVAVANTDYMQVRFLDMQGRERVRIDRPKDQTPPRIVPEGEMQDKGAKSYFQVPKGIPEGRTWHSNVNLNMERGEIEKPIRPTFRVSTPVFAGGSFRGVVVINLVMDRILKLLGHSADFDVYMVDREGEFIVHPDPDKAWSRYLPGRRSFDDEFGDGTVGGVPPYAFPLKAVFRNQDQARVVLVPNAGLLASLGGAGASETRVALTEREERWITEHPNVRVHNETDWPPFNFAENGTPKGYSVDFMNLLGKKTGLKIEYVTGPSWNEFLEMMRSGDLDVMLNIVKTPERQEYLLYTDPYFENPNTILSYRNKPYGSLEELLGKTVSVPRGFFYEEILKRDYPEINLHLVKNALEAMKAVSYGKADAALGELAVLNHLMDRHMMTDLAISGEVETGNPELVLLNIAVRKDLPVLLSILNKAMTAVSVEEERVLRDRWMPKTDRPDHVDLNRQQRRWLEEHPKFTLGIDSAWPPFEFLDNGAYSGIGAGYVELVARRLGIEMEPVHDLGWSEVIDKAKAGEIDILPTVMRTREREKFLAFTKPYVSFPMVISTRRDASFVSDLAGLAGRKVGVVRDYVTHELLERNHGDLDIVPFPTLADGLRALEDGQVVAFVDNLAAISYEAERAKLESVRIAAPTEYQFELAMAVRKDLSELVPILNLALDTITEQERAAIRNAWINVQVSFGTDIKTILTWAFPIGAGVLLIVGIIFVSNRRLGREVEERRKAQAKETEAHARLTDAHEIISESIDYAASIQRSILPRSGSFSTVFEDHFVIWEPRDRVGGDLYWHRLWGDGVLVMLADCTGHGVPGAFMTLIATGALDRAQEEVAPGDVGKLVQRMHQLVQLTLGQHTEGGTSDDGLELGVCYLGSDQARMTFAGARFSLFRLDGAEVEEIKGDKKGIGYRGIPYEQEFADQTIDLPPGQSFYLITDGVTDQVGGERRRMFGKRRFKELLISMKDAPMAEKKNAIQQTLTHYQGDERRRDDVSVLGFVVRKGKEVVSQAKAVLTFDSRLAVGFDEIDEDHKKLITLINELNESMESKDRDTIVRKLGGLYEYTRWHFQHEERMMQDSGYPDFDAHRREHLSLKDKVLDVKGRFDAGNDEALFLVPDFLKQWLVHHIQEVDKKLGRFLANTK